MTSTSHNASDRELLMILRETQTKLITVIETEYQ